MNEELRKVIKGYAKLSLKDQEEFRKRLNGSIETGRINESVEKSEQITMGPLGNGCPCCGR
ncbi:hypothetical protein [Rhizobium metallidurans]|uniref:Uncharacterized protein n=1 Tax=Rhizobium metallidurans TaxID=1265931 RepID=A0A7W6GC95_9HYPH|nr:hypothetical protein [Rhizobium metallidurans]MBB3965830.1 hypothetical protein [Rhizobium metallidurans]